MYGESESDDGSKTQMEGGKRKLSESDYRIRTGVYNNHPYLIIPTGLQKHYQREC